jgi:hypothetical protein
MSHAHGVRPNGGAAQNGGAVQERRGLTGGAARPNGDAQPASTTNDQNVAANENGRRPCASGEPRN